MNFHNSIANGIIQAKVFFLASFLSTHMCDNAIYILAKKPIKVMYGVNYLQGIMIFFITLI